MAVKNLLNDAKLASSGFRVSIAQSNRNKNTNAAILDFHVPPHGISTISCYDNIIDKGISIAKAAMREQCVSLVTLWAVNTRPLTRFICCRYLM